MSKIKLVMTDLDDTLLGSDKEISEANMLAINNLVDNGVMLVPTTGRYYGMIPEYLHNHNGVKYIVSSNGALITDNKQKKVLRKKDLASDLAYEIIALAEAKANQIALVTEGELIIDERVLKSPRFIENPEMMESFLSNATVVSDILQYLKDNPQSYKKIDLNFDDLEFRADLYDKLQKYPNVNAVSSHFTNIEITEQTTSKGDALLFLQEKYDLDRSEILAIGDNDNDISMIKNAGIGVAMGNASDKVKSHSDFVTLDNNNDGFAHAINTYFKF